MRRPISLIPWLPWQRIFLGLTLLTFLSGLAKAEEESSRPVEIANHGLDLNYMASEAGAAWIIRGVEIDGVGLADLNVAHVEVFAPDASIIIDDGLATFSFQDPPTTRFLRGEIAGIPGSVVALMQTHEGTISGLMTDGDATWKIDRRSPEAPLETVPIDSDTAIMEKPFACGNEQLPYPSLWQTAPADANDPPPSAELPAGQLYQATVAIETDYEFYALFGNITAATNYIGNLYNYISGIYEAEIQTRFLVGTVSLWTSATDPWVETSSTTCRLYEFGRYWREHRASVTRTLAHFLSGASLGGGVAWLDQLCAPTNTIVSPTGCASTGSDLVYGGFGVSANLSGTINTVAGPAWDAVVVAHEMGHNFSSPHTHCYSNIGGIASPVDACWNEEFGSGCWFGGTSLPGVGSLTGGSASGRNGTLMSFCHQRTGGIANIAGAFGLGHPYGVSAQRVPDKMFNRIAAVASANPSCIPVIGSSGYTVTATAGPKGTISPVSRTVTDGATTTFTVTPNADYSASASGCGGSLSGTTYTTGPITADCTVSATFALTSPPRFADVPFDHWAWAYIEAIALEGITDGCGGGNYCLDANVTRGQMAVFLLRGIHGGGYVPPPATGTRFVDVPRSHPFAAWIEQLAAEAITSGCGGNNYCPGASVTRGQMALFLLKAKSGSGYKPPPATETVFSDVPQDHWAAAWIEQLAAEGITTGCGGGNYCPGASVTRGHMAVFLQRTFDLPVPH